MHRTPFSKYGIVVERAYLFGSYVKGSWIKTSDIDLVVVSRDFEGMSFTERLDLINRLQ
ncbi:MAG: nucleotidyltransferase domain-containing protein [Candidatus Nezhaarchaeales archaeon]